MGKKYADIHVRLPLMWGELIDRLVESGLYKTRTEVLSDALRNYEPFKRLLESKEIEKLDEIADIVKKCIKSAEETLVKPLEKKWKSDESS